MAVIRVGIAQSDVRLSDREGNFERLEELLSRVWTKSEKPTAIVLPELWDVGYCIDAPGFCGDPETWQAAEFLGRVAKEYGCWFAGGSVFAVTDEGSFNRAMVVDTTGKYVAHYDKAHLFPLMDEDKYLRAGSERTHVNIGGVDAGFVICYDLRFCEWTRLYAVDGAQLLFISAEWPVERIEAWRLLLRATAVQNMMYVAACNRCGETDGIRFGGHSAVIDPWGETLWEGGDSEEFAFVDIDTDVSDKARATLRVLDARRPEIYK